MADFLHPIFNKFDGTCSKCKCETKNHIKIEDGVWFCQECDTVCELLTNKLFEK